MCPHRQNDRPGSHKHHFWNQAKDLPSCRSASFQLSPLCFTGIWRLLIWFWRLGPFSNVTAGFFNNVESLIWDSELCFFFFLRNLQRTITKNVLPEYSQLTGIKINTSIPDTKSNDLMEQTVQHYLCMYSFVHSFKCWLNHLSCARPW